MGEINIIRAKQDIDFFEKSNILTGKSITFKMGGYMRITSKGQVTIPQDIRLQFGLFPETEIEFEVVDEMLVLKKISGKKRTSDLLRKMSGKATLKMTTDEIMKLTRS